LGVIVSIGTAESDADGLSSHGSRNGRRGVFSVGKFTFPFSAGTTVGTDQIERPAEELIFNLKKEITPNDAINQNKIHTPKRGSDMTPEILARINATAISIGEILANEPKYMVDAFDIIARRELVEECDSIRHLEIIQQLDTIDRALDTIERTRREIIRSRNS
jgi:hypothetical protein